MRPLLLPTLVALLLAGVSTSLAAAGGKAEIRFLEPESYADAGESPSERKDVMTALDRHLQDLAKRKLAAGETLQVDVLDIDLAGRIRRVGPVLEEVRVIDGKVDWPTIKLRYRLVRGGAPVLDGEEALTDMTYFQKARTYPQSDTLRYEKPLIDRWFTTRVLGSNT